MNLKKIAILALTPMLFIACGKSRDHKPLSKLEVMSKSLIDTNKEYLYVASTGEVSRSTSMGRPYFQDQEQIITLAFEEHNLVAYSVDEETDFKENKTNKKVVFKIPIEHLEYREQTDAFGEGINIEEENKFVDWNERSSFKAKSEKFKFTSVSMLPTEFGKIFGDNSCNKEQGQTDVEFSVEKEGIDIVIRRDFISNYFCERGVEKLEDLAWSQETHYSLVPLEDVISKDYKAKEYSRDWEGTFGFFEKKEVKLNSANASAQSEEKYFMHRWNPAREFITYHLDPRFNKPENKVLKYATLKGIERLNATLKETGAKIRINTVDGDESFKPGDIKKSSIVLVEDPVGAGLLGYGPSVTNPRTGEIVQARTVMYPGIMKMLISRAYDEVIEIDQKKKLAALKAARPPEPTPQTSGSLAEGAVEKNSSIKWSSSKGDILRAEALLSSSPAVSTSVSSIVKNKFRSVKSFFKKRTVSIAKLFHIQSEKTDDQRLAIDKVDLFEAYSAHNMFPAAGVGAFSDITDKALIAKILELGAGVPWVKLTESVKSEIIDLTMPYVWIPTLIHEIGHNLGLRHNFTGSEDEENFYTKEELLEKGVNSDEGSPYSSMMEYSKSEITGLRVPGKYDAAALMYGYADKVELADGMIVDAGETVPEGIKVFKYCSDEGVALNPTCNRFDEGVDLVQIVESMIDSYNKRYETSYFRRDRSNFSMMDTFRDAYRVNSQFRALRLAYERYGDLIKTFMEGYGLSLEEVNEQVTWLKEYRDASVLAADFFMDVIAQPDYSCVIHRDNQFHSAPTFAELQVTNWRANDCSDVELAPGFKVVGSFGRSLQDIRYADNPNRYLDQVDVKGVWFHKVLAMKYLTARQLNSYSFDENTFSYLDHPDVGEKVSNFIKSLVYGDVSTEVTLTLNNGFQQKVPYPYNLGKGYEIQTPLDWRLSYVVGTPRKNMEMAALLIQEAKYRMYRGDVSSEARSFTDSFEVYRSEVSAANEQVVPYKVKGRTFLIKDTADVALKIIESEKLVSLYESFTRNELIDIYNTMLPPPTPENPEGVTADADADADRSTAADDSAEGITADEAPVTVEVEVTDEGVTPDEPPAPSKKELEVRAAGINSLVRYLNGGFSSSEYFYKILSAM